MSTATRVPETHELEGEDALNALRRAGWPRTRSSASAPPTASANDLHPPRSGWTRLSRPGVGGRC
jgi:hypothetical protein